MTIHPKIKGLIELLEKYKITREDLQKHDSYGLEILKETEASSTEAMVVLHQGFGFTTIAAEEIVKASKLWMPEAIQDIAYQTFLYTSYNPDDPNFSYDENKVKFSLIPPTKKSDNEE